MALPPRFRSPQPRRLTLADLSYSKRKHRANLDQGGAAPGWSHFGCDEPMLIRFRVLGRLTIVAAIAIAGVVAQAEEAPEREEAVTVLAMPMMDAGEGMRLFAEKGCVSCHWGLYTVVPTHPVRGGTSI